MLDPLADFRWDSLAARYDARCRGFDSRSTHLVALGDDRPASDRALYHRLVSRYTPSARVAEADPVSVYEALLYWKYYSQGTADRNIALLGTPGGEDHQRNAGAVRQLIAALPATLDRNVDDVVRLVCEVSSYNVPCMGMTALPTKTTFLHFVYPDVVPVFDKQVLKASGEPGSGNHSFRVLRQYLPFAWELADRYTACVPAAAEVTTLRAVDMALWVHRGAASKC